MTKRVEIRTVIDDYYGESIYSTEIYLNDVLIDSGSYGGEPEDNSIFRNYQWVERMLAKLATALGAKIIYKELDRGKYVEPF